jgi:hypothetical protein
LRSAITKAVKKADPKCAGFVGVIVQRQTPKAPFDADWAIEGVRFGKADQDTSSLALATIVERMQRELVLARTFLDLPKARRIKVECLIRVVSMKKRADQDKNLTKAPSIDCPRASGKLKMLRLFIGILASNVVISSQASSQSLDQFERMSQFEKAMVAVDQIRSRKKLQCLISIRNRSLCECLSTNLPFTLHISNYVSIANQDKGTADYGQLSTADRQSVDQCVADNH